MTTRTMVMTKNDQNGHPNHANGASDTSGGKQMVEWIIHEYVDSKKLISSKVSQFLTI